MIRLNLLKTTALLVLTCIAVGCGDDDSDVVDSGTDTLITTDDTGVDSSLPDTAVEDTILADTIPPDTGTPTCSPFEASSCDEGKCSFAFERRTAMADRRFTCVDDDVTKDEGVPCSYSVKVSPDDPTDLFYADDCAQGLICSLSEPISRCRRLCDSDLGVGCEGEDYCGTLSNDPYVGLCFTPSFCDPVYQTGCPPGQGCGIRPNTNGDLVSECVRFVPIPGRTGATGEACDFENNCLPGHRCELNEAEDARTCVAFCLVGDPPDPVPESDFDGSCDTVCEPITAEDGGRVLTPTMAGLCVTE